MTLRFSPSTRGFYDVAIHGDTIPADAVEISDDLHRELLEAQAKGHAIDVDARGQPVIAPVERPPTRARLERLIKREAQRRIEIVAPLWRQLNDLRSGAPDAARRFAEIDAIRHASERVEAELTATGDADLASFDVTGSPYWTDAP